MPTSPAATCPATSAAVPSISRSSTAVHQFELALRDFINIEKHCSPRSTVLIHRPLSAEPPHGREGATKHLLVRRVTSGGSSFALRKYRPDLSVNVIAASPTWTGDWCAAWTRDRTCCRSASEDIVREYLAMDYSVLDADKPGMLALYPNDWDKACRRCSRP